MMISTAATIAAQTLSVTQTDTRNLLVYGRVDLYLSLTDSQGRLVTDPEQAAVIAEEILPDGSQRGLEIVGMLPEAGRLEGINFLLLIDNSGSMYRRFGEDGTRIDYVRTALRHFISGIPGSADRVAMAAFNTFLHPLAPLGASAGELTRALDRIEQPDGESKFTEHRGE